MILVPPRTLAVLCIISIASLTSVIVAAEPITQTASVAAESLQSASDTTVGNESETVKSARPTVESAPPSEDQAPGRIAEITRGEEVDLKAHLVAGKTTIVDFHSPFCPPCVKLKPHLKALVEASSDLALLMVNINRDGVKGIDWGSPVVAQYGIRGVPHFKIFDPDGNLVAEGDEAFERVYELISEFQNRK